MNLVMTLLVRDESDVVDAQITFHLNAGVDFVIATDHNSEDGTTEILESYARDGYLRLIREDADEVRQSEWVTRMARLAAVEFGADWVINSDADEFWWPRARSLKEALAVVPQRYGVVYAPVCYFLPRQRAGPFYEVMTVRLLQAAPINSPLSRYRPTMKAAHRASPTAVVRRGNHDVEQAGRPLRGWHPLEVLHFPDRSPEQFARKYAHTVTAWPTGGREPGAFVLAAHGAIGRAGAHESFDSLSISEEEIADSAAHAFGIDTRLRDALRRLRSSTGAFLLPDQLSNPPDVPPPSALDEARHVADVAALAEAEFIRAQRRADDLNVRIRAIARGRDVRDVPRLLSPRSRWAALAAHGPRAYRSRRR